MDLRPRPLQAVAEGWSYYLDAARLALVVLDSNLHQPWRSLFSEEWGTKPLYTRLIYAQLVSSTIEKLVI